MVKIILSFGSFTPSLQRTSSASDEDEWGYLIKKGVDKSRIKIDAVGDTQATSDNDASQKANLKYVVNGKKD